MTHNCVFLVFLKGYYVLKYINVRTTFTLVVVLENEFVYFRTYYCVFYILSPICTTIRPSTKYQ